MTLIPFFFFSCQFLVKEDDYSAYLVDPDILVDWDHIEQIVRIFIVVFLYCMYLVSNFAVSLIVSIILCFFFQRVFSHDVPCCPICLYPPVAGSRFSIFRLNYLKMDHGSIVFYDCR